MQKYEYKIIRLPQQATQIQEKILNDLGAQGWHLVAELDDGVPTHSLVFERPLPG